jgi:hypothetical protein
MKHSYTLLAFVIVVTVIDQVVDPLAVSSDSLSDGPPWRVLVAVIDMPITQEGLAHGESLKNLHDGFSFHLQQL